ncbi:MAG: N-carbamoyl-L-amino acid hydrolase, partial [uncultured Thermoleophilia bacterium]
MTTRLQERLDRLYGIGGGVGANRPALSQAEQEAHDLVAGWMREDGLEVEVDPIGNLWGRLPGGLDGPEVWTGSHLDSVPQGGRLDGALGVLAGVEALGRLRARGGRRRTLAVVAFRDEEGWRFDGGFLGSRALTGRLAPGALEARDADGVSVREALVRLGLDPDPPRAGWVAVVPAAYVELHVEQGPRLATADVPLGVVTSITGMAGYDVVFEATGGHAGTVPMATRADAL